MTYIVSKKRRRPLQLLAIATAATLLLSQTAAFCFPKVVSRIMVQSQQPLRESTTELDYSCSNEFELQVGKALDTLKHDYPKILTDQPDFSIYDPSIEVVDPSGVKVHGIGTYKNSFRVLHALVNLIYCPNLSDITFRMCFDKARQNIRIHWNARVVPRQIFGGYRTTLHVDGISVYEMDMKSGNITQHRIEKLIMNDRALMPEKGIIHALKKEYAVTVPSYIDMGETGVVPFQEKIGVPSMNQEPSLFAMEASEGYQGGEAEDFDYEAFESKNKSRKKFGLKPLSVEEFMEIQVEVKKLDAQQRQRMEAAAAEMEMAKRNQPKPSLFDKMFGELLKDTCESNWDCERPEVCCDFGFKKMCCSSGSFVGQEGALRYAEVPVPVDIGYPPGQGPENGYPPPRY